MYSLHHVPVFFCLIFACVCLFCYSVIATSFLVNKGEYIYMNPIAQLACNFNCVVETEVNVTGSHVYTVTVAIFRRHQSPLLSVSRTLISVLTFSGPPPTQIFSDVMYSVNFRFRRVLPQLRCTRLSARVHWTSITEYFFTCSVCKFIKCITPSFPMAVMAHANYCSCCEWL